MNVRVSVTSRQAQTVRRKPPQVSRNRERASRVMLCLPLISWKTIDQKVDMKMGPTWVSRKPLAYPRHCMAKKPNTVPQHQMMPEKKAGLRVRSWWRERGRKRGREIWR